MVLACPRKLRKLVIIQFIKKWNTDDADRTDLHGFFKSLSHVTLVADLVPTRCVGMQYQRAALRNNPQRGLPEFPRSAWELGISLGIFLFFVDEMIFPG